MIILKNKNIIFYGMPLIVMLLTLTIIYNKYGVLFTFTESDSSSSFFEGITLLKNNIHDNFLLSDESYLKVTRLGALPDSREVYTSNPWVWPRLGTACLHLLGVSSITLQNLIICLFSLVLMTYYLLRIDRKYWPFVGLVFLFISLDYLSGIRFYSNLGLIWYFVILSSIYHAIFSHRFSYVRLLQANILSGFYVLIYYFWMLLTCILYSVVIQYKTKISSQLYIKRLAVIAFIIAIPLTFFLIQLYCYHGSFSRVWIDFTSKLQIRSTATYSNKIPFSNLLANYASKGRDYLMPLDSIDAIRHASANIIAQYGYLILSIALVGLVSGIKSLLYSNDTILNKISAFGLISAVAILPIMLIFRGSFYMLYVYHAGPLLAICIAQLFALGVIHISLYYASFFKGSTKIDTITWPAFLLSTLLLTSYSWASFQIYSPIIGNPFKHLETGIYKGQPMVMIPADLSLFVYAATGLNPAYVDRPKYVLCIDNWRMRNQRGGLTCKSLADGFQQDIKIIHTGPEWFVIQFKDSYPKIRDLAFLSKLPTSF